ncbi:glycosyltransferase family 4 protein [Clostridium saudiense]|uniref:glycosyltransferase family 4 protein n=1 Tax=Clostridium saudiense TaxID=1414720 RepID=UPI00319EB8EB
MKILYVTALNETINAFLIPHIEKLVEEGNEVHCACNINREISFRLINKNVIYHSIEFSRSPLKINYIKVINNIRTVYLENKYDIVHVHTPIASFLTRFALKNYSVKIIYTAHGFHFFKGAPLVNWLLYYPLERIAAYWTDRIVTINNEDFERAMTFKLRNNGNVMLMHGVGIDPKEYTLSEFNRDEYRKDIGVDKSDFMLLILADINKNKNHIQVIKAINELRKKNNNIKVICAGEGPLRSKLTKKISALGLEDKIKFLGFRNDVKELINSSDCVGLFSMREGLPKSLMEGIACGKPLIASNIRGCKDIAGYKNIGVIVNPSDYRSILNGLNKIINSKYNLKIIKKEVEKYSLSRVLEEVYQIHEI